MNLFPIGNLHRRFIISASSEVRHTFESLLLMCGLDPELHQVVFSKQATVKVLVAHWRTTLAGTENYLQYLNFTDALCKSSVYNHCKGKVEIKNYEVPGWDATGPAVVSGALSGNKYPGFTRVNHAKFAVSDVRAHVGTNNLVWDYFYATAGVSFGTYDPRIVSQLQAIFDADWTSPYAIPF